MTLINESGATITKASVTNGSNSVAFERLRAGDKMSATLPITREGGYAVSVQFADGRQLRANMGYVDPRIDASDTIRIRSSKIELDGVVSLDKDGKRAALAP